MKEWPPMWRVSVNILNKQLQTNNKGWSSAWRLGELLTTPHHKKLLCYKTQFLQVLIDALAQLKELKREMRFGLWNACSSG
jgi:hypothetical protein